MQILAYVNGIILMGRTAAVLKEVVINLGRAEKEMGLAICMCTHAHMNN